MELKNSDVIKLFLRAVAALIIVGLVLVHLHAAVNCLIIDVTSYENVTGEKIVGSVLDSQYLWISVLLSIFFIASAVVAVWSMVSTARRFDYLLLLVSLGLIAVFFVCNQNNDLWRCFRGAYGRFVSELHHDLNDDIMIQELKRKVILWPTIASAGISFVCVLQDVYDFYCKSKEKQNKKEA